MRVNCRVPVARGLINEQRISVMSYNKVWKMVESLPGWPLATKIIQLNVIHPMFESQFVCAVNMCCYWSEQIRINQVFLLELDEFLLIWTTSVTLFTGLGILYKSNCKEFVNKWNFSPAAIEIPETFYASLIIFGKMKFTYSKYFHIWISQLGQISRQLGFTGILIQKSIFNRYSLVGDNNTPGDPTRRHYMTSSSY